MTHGFSRHVFIMPVLLVGEQAFQRTETVDFYSRCAKLSLIHRSFVAGCEDVMFMN